MGEGPGTIESDVENELRPQRGRGAGQYHVGEIAEMQFMPCGAAGCRGRLGIA